MSSPEAEHSRFDTDVVTIRWAPCPADWTAGTCEHRAYELQDMATLIYQCSHCGKMIGVDDLYKPKVARDSCPFVTLEGPAK